MTRQTHLRWAVAFAVVAIASVDLAAQQTGGLGIPLLRSVNAIVDSLLQIVRPVAVIALILSGLMWMFGEGSVRYIAQLLFGGAIAVFAVSIVNALF